MTYRSNALVLAEDDSRRADELAARTDGLILSLGGTLPNPHRDALMFANLTPADHVRDFHAKRNQRMPDALRSAWENEVNAHQRGIGTDDLPALLDNVSDKQARLGYTAAPVSYPLWCSIGVANNYRRSTVVGASEFPALPRVAENAEVPLATRSDAKEFVQVYKYAQRSRVTDQVIFGDDASVLVSEPFEYGKAARMTVQREVSALLTSNSGTGPTLNQTGLVLFHATHGNYTNPGAAPSVSTLDTARQAMRLRTDPTSGNVLNCVPRVLLVPAALETVARVLAQSQNSALADAEGDLLVAVDPNLDAGTNGTVAWYLTADPAKFSTVLVSFLNGMDSPTVESLRPWEIDGIEFRVRIDFAVTPVDYRTLHRNRGT
jgi:hypothetical protein